MSFDYEDKETNRLQAAALWRSSLDRCRRFWVLTFLPHTMPLEAWRGWHPESEVEGGLLREEGICQGLPPDISSGSLRQHLLHAHFADVTCMLTFRKQAVFNLVKDNRP